MFSKKYIFETNRTRYFRYFKNIVLTLCVCSFSIFFFGPYLIYASNQATQVSGEAYYQKSPDLIVVFTGDKGRIPEAIELSKKHEASKLYISGVHNKNYVDKLVRLTGNSDDPELDTNKIEIDYQARNTLENVIYTFQFIRNNPELKNILIISSDYHIYRIQKIINALGNNKDGFKVYFHGTETDFKSVRSIKILYKEIYKIIQAQAFLLMWNGESTTEVF